VRCRGFAPRNAAAVRHSAYSAVRVGELATLIEDELRGIVPAVDPSHEPTIRLLARELARIELVDRWLDEHGILDENGEPRGVLKMRSVWTNSAARLANDLALNPSAQAKLKLHVVRAKGEALAQHLDQHYAGEGGS
jgi:hypothetical protein